MVEPITSANTNYESDQSNSYGATGANNGFANNSAGFTEAIEQMKAASASVYEAVAALRRASTNAAREKIDDGKVKAKSLEAEVEAMVSEKPLMYLGAAFVAGWLVSKLMKS